MPGERYEERGRDDRGLLVMAGVWAAVLVGALGVLLAANVAEGRGRDVDGSRGQARPVQLGESQTDRLHPPRDAADWRYFKLNSAKQVSVMLRAQPPEAAAQLQLTSATGASMGAASTSGGVARVDRRLAPGLYYVGVSGRAAVSYTVSIR